MKVIGEDPEVLKNGRWSKKKVTEEKVARYYH